MLGHAAQHPAHVCTTIEGVPEKAELPGGGVRGIQSRDPNIAFASFLLLRLNACAERPGRVTVSGVLAHGPPAPRPAGWCEAEAPGVSRGRTVLILHTGGPLPPSPQVSTSRACPGPLPGAHLRVSLLPEPSFAQRAWGRG